MPGGRHDRPLLGRTLVMLLTLIAAPAPVRGDSAAQVVAGDFFTCALTTAGGVKCWGQNFYGQLGDATTVERHTPVAVTGLGTGVSTVAAGHNHACAITSGALVCWGRNQYGQLGDGTTVDRSTPVGVSGLGSGVVAVAAGAAHTCALTASGGAKCWGANLFGMLGNGTQVDTPTPTPVDVSGLTSGVTAVAAGYLHSCALLIGGGLKCWGAGGYVGDGTTTTRLTPVDVSGLTIGVGAVDTNDGHTCALTTTGSVQCWGSNVGGQLGDGTTTDRSAPVNVSGLGSGASALVPGGGHTCVVTTSGGMKCWGFNVWGQLGDGTTTNQTTPVDVSGLGGSATTAAAGGTHTCAALVGGNVTCWGVNNRGQLGNGTVLLAPSPVPSLVVGFGEPCGDGVVDGGEQCDDGNRVAGDCCSTTCQYESAGSPCASDGNLCTDDACDGSGVCAHPAGNAGAVCRAATGECDAAEMCSGASPTCPADAGPSDLDGDDACDAEDPCTFGGVFATPPKAKVTVGRINTDPTPGNDRLRLGAQFQLPAGQGFGDLRPDLRGARLVVDADDGSHRIDAVLPAGSYAGTGTRGWKSSASGKSWTFIDRTGSPVSGVTSVRIVDRASTTSPRAVRIAVTGKGGSYPIADEDAPLRVAVTLGDATDAIQGRCGESAFDPTDCAFNRARSKLTCKR